MLETLDVGDVAVDWHNLDLASNLISELRPRQLEAFRSLRRLVLSDNLLTTISLRGLPTTLREL
jgi:Leucine-rich repeat (LRR) protein